MARWYGPPMSHCRDFFGREIHPRPHPRVRRAGGRQRRPEVGPWSCPWRVSGDPASRAGSPCRSRQRSARAAAIVAVKRRVVLTFPERCVVVSA